MFRIAVCDEEAGCRELLVRAAKGFGSQQNRELLVDSYADALHLLTAMEKGKGYDLIFLDADLPGFSGIEFGKKLREERRDFRTEIVYLSAKEVSYRELLETGPLHFLEKPADIRLVQQDIGKAVNKKEAIQGIFCYHTGREQLQTEVIKIYYFISQGRQVRMVTEEGEALFYDRMDRIDSQLAIYGFVRIHRGTLINCRHVKRYGHDKAVMDNDVVLQISPGRKAALQIRRFHEQNKSIGV